jgi:hypothetical protein
MLNKGGHRGGAFLSYFKDLFSAGENLDVAACVEVLDSKVTPAMNQQLLSKFTIGDSQPNVIPQGTRARWLLCLLLPTQLVHDIP